MAYSEPCGTHIQISRLIKNLKALKLKTINLKAFWENC